VATECCVASAAAAFAVVLLGPTALALGVLAACALTMAPAMVAVAHLERRESRD
jgi:hypothetical protein